MYEALKWSWTFVLWWGERAAIALYHPCYNYWVSILGTATTDTQHSTRNYDMTFASFQEVKDIEMAVQR
jgi:hypothetical protein